MQKETLDGLVMPFGRASQMVKRNSHVPQHSSPVRPEAGECGNEYSSTQSSCVIDSSDKECTDEIITDVKKKVAQMVWMNDSNVRNCSITQLPHPSQLRRKKRKHFEKTKPLGWDFMCHVQQLHRKKEEFESKQNDGVNLGNFVPERNLMYVHVVRNQTEVPTDAEETEKQNINELASSPPKMRERSFHLFKFSEE